MNNSFFCTLALVALSAFAQGSTAELTPDTGVRVTADSTSMFQSKVHFQIEAQITDEIESLLNWAKSLSGYNLNVEIPELRFETKEFFIHNACGGRDNCRVIGWYNDRKIIHIDNSMHSLDSLFSRSLVVHELVHYLQHVSGRYPDSGCASYVKREREAYAAQQQFFIAYGAMPGIQTHYFSCNKLNSGEIVLAHGQ